MLLPRACLTDHSLACLGRNQNFITLCSFILLLCRILKQLYYCKICFVVVVDDGKNNWDWHWSIFPLTRSHIWLCITYFLNKQAAFSIVMLAPQTLKLKRRFFMKNTKRSINPKKNCSKVSSVWNVKYLFDESYLLQTIIENVVYYM